MPPVPVIAIFDIGRTHKKFLLFDQDYKVFKENSIAFPDISDDDGDPCEDLHAIASWMREQLHDAFKMDSCDIKAINFSAHGASLVHIDADGNAATPLYDYMKPLPESVTEGFYDLFGGKRNFSLATGSPVLNMLNSGIQLYWLKNHKPDAFARVGTSLHLPQYGNYLFSGKAHADITSIGCHTGLWDFDKQHYHAWLGEQKVADRLPAAESVTAFDEVSFGGTTIPVGIGIHDSSAALLPFVYTANEPFLLLSSGTWNITLDPFFEGDLTEADYGRDCLYYLLEKKRRVAASRLFLGNEYQHQVKKLEAYFQKPDGYYLEVLPTEGLFEQAMATQGPEAVFYPETMGGTGPFPELRGTPPDLSQFSSFEEAYHKLMLDLTYLQKVSIELLCRNKSVRRLYVSGGFVQSRVFMEVLSAFLPGWSIFIAENKRASALGAAVTMHDLWQAAPVSEKISPIIPFQPSLHIALAKYHSFFEPRQ